MSLRRIDLPKSEGTVSHFDRATQTGVVMVGGKAYRFHSVNYRSSPNRYPREGERVEVVMSAGTPFEVREKPRS